MKFRTLSIAGPKGQNQDAIMEPFQIGHATWCGIADGVGSTVLGGLAARISLEEVKSVASHDASMTAVFSRVAHRLSRFADEKKADPKSLSTTLSVLCIEDSLARLGHVGDTRITHYRGHGVMLRTKDHTEVQKLLDDGVLSKSQARRYPRRHVLLSAMSAGRDYDLCEDRFSVHKGDRILLTSDGFHSKLVRGQLAELSAKTPDFYSFWCNIQELLSATIIEDDASCLALEIE